MNSNLEKLISWLPEKSLALLVGNSPILRNGDVPYPFRQSSNFLWAMGVSSPDCLVTIYSGEVIFWRDPISEKEKLWWTDKWSDGDIAKVSGIVDIRDKTALIPYIANIRNSISTWWIDASESGEISDMPSLLDPEKRTLSFTEQIHKFRTLKSEEEIEKMKRAITVTQEAFWYIEKILKPWMYEYEIEAEIARIFRAYHMTEAYPTIVASGINSCTLHYMRYDRRIETGDAVLIDAGAEYQGYAADMTRTFFVGWANPRQRAIFDSVGRIKEFAESILKPGIILIDYEKQVRDFTNNELILLELISVSAWEEEKETLFKKYYPHKTSHFLGLDVHDVGDREAIFEPGMIVTVEPGIYIPEEKIWIRREDDILITASNSSNLSLF